jgi:hypothetical protein
LSLSTFISTSVVLLIWFNIRVRSDKQHATHASEAQ